MPSAEPSLEIARVATKAYQRPDLPDGHTDVLLSIVRDLLDGAHELERARPDGRDPSIAIHANIDARKVMRRSADRLQALAIR